MQTKDYSEVREWAQGVMDNPWQEANSRMRVVAKTLLDLLPKMTMADIGWDDDTHHLTGATSPGGDVVMMWHDVDDSEQIICVDSAWYPVQLTPNGKQYKLVEATVSSNENVGLDQPEHPTVLETQQDFEDAPVGTIAAPNQCSPYMKYGLIRWKDMSDDTFSDEDMSGAALKVLRWGWGA